MSISMTLIIGVTGNCMIQLLLAKEYRPPGLMMS